MIPEILALDSRPNVIRIPNQIDIPSTDRVMRLIDSRPFRRLSKISQLGLVGDVYPGAKHSRFEHSLGVYRNALLFCRRILQSNYFANLVEQHHLESMVVAALLHDIGHWPYCHVIEDMKLEHIPAHEEIARSLVLDSEISSLLQKEWACEPNAVANLILGQSDNAIQQILASILSGPIDVDKMDYLYRDSLHCGVPYGMNFDSGRLINALCLNDQKNGIAISPKGKTAAEMMVFARYVMFSEVYWHHTVRSATAMLQRLCYTVYQNDESSFYAKHCDSTTDTNFVQKLADAVTDDHPSYDLFDGLYGLNRSLYKRVAEYTFNQSPKFFEHFSHRPYSELCQCGQALARSLSDSCGTTIEQHELLIDAPPPGLEVQFKVAIHDGTKQYQMEELSPIVKALATEQFDSFVKKVRVFVHPRIATDVSREKIEEAISLQLYRDNTN